MGPRYVNHTKHLANDLQRNLMALKPTYSISMLPTETGVTLNMYRSMSPASNVSMYDTSDWNDVVDEAVTGGSD